jgi:hypothetical protein
MGNYIMGGEGEGLHALVLNNGGLNVVIHTIFTSIFQKIP